MPDELEMLPALEEHAYRLLVKLDRARPDDLAAITTLSHAEAARVLQALQARGLAAAQPGEDAVFRPCRPTSPSATTCCAGTRRWSGPGSWSPT
ncbi:helix-turn-helix domain-containing protein [Catellatospora coxensis]